MAHTDARWFNPTLLSKADYLALAGCARPSNFTTTLDQCRALRRLADESEAAYGHDAVVGHLRLAVAASVLADLCEQEWHVDLRGDNHIWISPPDWTHTSGHDVGQIKSRVRNSLQVASDRQIATESVREFIRFMERNRAFNGKVVSIATLIDDGPDLCEQLKTLAPRDKTNRARHLGKLINPYLQACEDGATCEHTGLNLIDIWRYFRHTWSLEYNSVPGRTLRILVRNKGRANHPVIGIAMLASPAANMYVRDGWIGWRLDDVIDGLTSGRLEAAVIAKVLWSTIKTSISEIRSDDLLSEAELRRPTEETFFKLRQIAGLAQRKRREHLSELLDGTPVDDTKIVDIRTFRKKDLDWRRLSETPLFVKKRAEQLILLLRAYVYLKAADFHRFPEAALYESIVTKEGRTVITFALNELRKRKLATEAADLSVCGAIEPYNHLVGGKLVALLIGSQEARSLYAQRYARQESEIASQMAGRSIVRSTNLFVATTTSLYGVSSSQYNRLKIHDPDLEWTYLGQTEGLTVTHLSRRTVEIMRVLGTQVYGARRINSVFGEGSSPRTRQIREGLNLIGINNSLALEQSIGRRVYACDLVSGGRQMLTGFSGRKRQQRSAPGSAITRAWIDRWVVNRVLNFDVLEKLRQCSPAAISKAFKERMLRGVMELDEPTLDLRRQGG